MDSAGERFEAIRTALADRSNVLTVKELCQLAGVSRSGYYNWMSSQRARELREERDRASFAQMDPFLPFPGPASCPQPHSEIVDKNFLYMLTQDNYGTWLKEDFEALPAYEQSYF